jgi:uncharacterized membrane protein YgaE (UPF0421/DUF939 family)
MPEVAGRYSNKCAVDGYTPRDMEMYYRMHRKTADQKRSVVYSMCVTCFDAGKSLSNEELEKL